MFIICHFTIRNGFTNDTWEHLPYRAVLKSDHRTATVCCFVSCKILMVYGHYAHQLRKVSIELPRFAVLESVHRTATVDSFEPQKKSADRGANSGSSIDTF